MNTDALKQYWADVKAGRRPAPARPQPTGIIRKRVRCQSSWCRGGEIILIIYPHGEIGFKEPRRRAEYRLTVTEGHRSAVVITTNRLRARVKELKKDGMGLAKARRKARKELGLA